MQADEQGRTVYLQSSNIINHGFYTFHGFEVVGQVAIGENDPTWDRPAVVLELVSTDYACLWYITNIYIQDGSVS